MDAFEQSTAVYAAAVAIAKSINDTQELTRLGLLITELGTTLTTLAALQQLEQGNGTLAADIGAAEP